MTQPQRWTITWTIDGVSLRAFEPSPSEVADAAATLAAFYNEPYNRRMMTNSVAMTDADVVDHYRAMAAAGGRPFLLTCDGALVGDADLRGVRDGGAEMAIMIGDRSRQGQGLGTRFAVMVHGFAFQVLKLRRLYVAVILENEPSLRLFDKLGYCLDDSPAARTYADEASDVTLAVGAAGFLQAQRDALTQIAFHG